MKNVVCRFIIVVSIGSLIDSCNYIENNNAKMTKSNLSIFKDDSVRLAFKNLDFGKLLSFDFFSDSTFAISTLKPSGIFIFNINGEEVNQISSVGRGPGEFSIPSILRIYNDTLFSWCSEQLKMQMFDKNLIYLGEIPSLNKRALSDFIIQDNLICFYQRGGWDKVIAVFDRNKFEYVFYGGVGSEEHKLLDLNSNAGRISVLDKYLYFTYADGLTLYKLDLDEFDMEKISISDKDFIVSELNVSAEEMINTRNEKLIDYLLNNSYVKGVFQYRNEIIIQAETGFYQKKIFGNMIDYSNRFINYYKYKPDKKLETVKVAITNKLDLEYYPVYSTYMDNFYSITGHLENDNFYYQLNKLSFQ